MVCLPDGGRGEAGYLESMLSNFSASYKLYWFKGILEEVIDGKSVISFSDIISRMIASAWYPVLYYNLNLGCSDQLADAIKFIAESKKFTISRESSTKQIIDFVNDCRDPELLKKKKNFENMVPYRLIRPFFEKELVLAKKSGVKDHVLNSLIEKYSVSNEQSLYKIDKNLSQIIVSSRWIDYLKRNEVIIRGWLNYKLVDYLQKRNPSIPAIPYKIFPPEKRDLSLANNVWKKVIRYSGISDIYTGLQFSVDNQREYGVISIDHFIPWSFVLHDELWNLCPTFKNINSKKGNRIPTKDYIAKFCSLQYAAFMTAKQVKIPNKQLESYLTIKEDIFQIEYGQDIGRGVFEEAVSDAITPLYQIAQNNGYVLWYNDPLKGE